MNEMPQETVLIIIVGLVTAPASCWLTMRLVLKARITSKARAFLVGLGAIPAAFAVAIAAIFWTYEPNDLALVGILTMCFAFEAMLCGWAGAFCGLIATQAASGQPDLVRKAQAVVDKARSQPCRRTMNDGLLKRGLPDTRVNVVLYSIGGFGSASGSSRRCVKWQTWAFGVSLRWRVCPFCGGC
jgi:hypothetical protein